MFSYAYDCKRIYSHPKFDKPLDICIKLHLPLLLFVILLSSFWIFASLCVVYVMLYIVIIIVIAYVNVILIFLDLCLSLCGWCGEVSQEMQ